MATQVEPPLTKCGRNKTLAIQRIDTELSIPQSRYFSNISVNNLQNLKSIMNDSII